MQDLLGRITGGVGVIESGAMGNKVQGRKASIFPSPPKEDAQQERK